MTERLDADDPCPVRDGFSWPAEWAPHARTWMCWPCRIEAWGGPDGLLRAKQAFARVARAISTFEPVTMAVRPHDAAEAKLACAGKVEIFEVPLDDSWARDMGPTFLRGPDGAARRGAVALQCLGQQIPSLCAGRAARDAYRPRLGRAGLRRAAGLRGRRDPRRRRGHADHDRAMPAQRQPQSRTSPSRRSRSAWRCSPARVACSGWARASRTTRPTAMSTTSPVSPAPGRVIVGVPPSSKAHPDFEPVKEADPPPAGRA